MKLILLLGIFVFVEIVVGHNEHQHNKSRQKRGHESHKKELHFTKEGHKESHVRSPNAVPSAPGQQERFHKFLDKWEKFSEPNKKWHKAPLHKKNHDENEKHMMNNKETLVTNNQHKMAFGKRKHHEIEAHHNKLNKKANDEPKHVFRNRVGKLDDLKANIKGKWKKSHLALKDRMQKRKNMWNKRRFRDFSRHMSKYGHEQIRKNLDKHRNHKTERKDNDMEKENHSNFQRRHHFLERKSHFGRRAEGHKPFGRQSKMDFGPDSRFCKRQTVKCPDYKREVCGSDGKTYQNRCLLMSELCKKDSKIDLNLTKRGACDERNIVH